VINHHFLLGQAGLLQFRIIPSIDTALGQWHFSGMATDHLPASSELLNQRLAEKGLRATSQRQHVYGVLLGQRDHPSAEEVFMRAKQSKPEISMATVYNSLDALVKCGVVRQVNVDRGATLFCSNMGEHAHFCCDDCGKVFDMNLKGLPCVPEVDVPGEFVVRKIDIALHGRCTGKCSDCGRKEAVA
jgi:Fur family peroxide stress response transcriptional regulator